MVLRWMLGLTTAAATKKHRCLYSLLYRIVEVLFAFIGNTVYNFVDYMKDLVKFHWTSLRFIFLQLINLKKCFKTNMVLNFVVVKYIFVLQFGLLYLSSSAQHFFCFSFILLFLSLICIYILIRSMHFGNS